MATFTSKATGNWDSEGATTWNEANHPVAGDTVTIQNGHTVTLDSAAACANLTIDSGGVLTDATNNVGITVSYRTIVSGTLTCGTAAISIGSGETTLIPKLEIKAGGVFTGGSGSHTIGTIESLTATSTLIMTSGTCTLDGSDSNGYGLGVAADSTFAHSDGDIIVTNPAGTFNFFVDSHDLYNLTVNHAGNSYLYADLGIENNFTLTAGTFKCDEDGAPSHGVTVGGITSITGTLDCIGGEIDFDGNFTINGGGVVEATTGTTYFSGGTWTNNGTFTHNEGSVVFDGGNQAIFGSNTWYDFTKTWAVASQISLTIDNTSTQTFEHNVALEAASAISRISLLSDSAGDAFNFTMTATAVKTALDFLSIKDSDASGSDASHKPIAPTNTIDVSGNTDWFSLSLEYPSGNTTTSYYY